MLTEVDRAELDTAITAARRNVMGEAMLLSASAIGGKPEPISAALDLYRDLIDVRARWDEHAVVHRRDNPEKPMWCGRCPEIKAAARRLLGETVDGSTEAESARKQDQPSG